ncbi:MAG TPA: hypothetical protein VN224_09350 [Xanthomonadales bacterium]|nr:hypothetical protein [Xanthomonadales bacterium]
MTIMATHFTVVLGAWRLRIRLDIDEPREDVVEAGHVRDETSAANHAARYRTVPTMSSAPRWN